MPFPDDSIQELCLSGDWWVSDNSTDLNRGRLIWAYVSYPGQEPLVIEPTGRKSPRDHGGAHVQIKRLRISERKTYLDLPTAALSLDGNQCWAGYRAKKRPCLVLSCLPFSTGLPKSREKMMAGHLKTSTILVAPYYGGDQDGTRGGFPEEFIEGIRHARCPQLFYEQLPLSSKVRISILRFDHLQTIGSHYNSYKATDYRLSDDAVKIVDEWFDWYIKGIISKKGNLRQYHDLIADFFG
ncbi:hypothetical protein [Desulfopila sp. IMCC35008]|uniref:hypothetical protein n=1 Tax=Desulfopila sp. IMCC35008 TaxID=2653858 RepID=UPI0013CFB483|nr:hypothetical protein [Desulfopila sp. IMCC35008]